jgi:uncharacterized protein (UPF0332 family)
MLLDAGDYRGAVNRAYYAMFDLARHTLRAIDPRLAAAKKHSTIIARFSKHMIQEKGYPREIGQALRKVFDARLVGDYADAAPTLQQAREVIEAMERFFEVLAAGEGATKP